MTTLTQIAVPFHAQELLIVEHNNQPYTPMRPIVEGMGLAWEAQYSKLKQRFASTIMEIITVANDGKERLMICLPLRKLFGWLMTISPNKVKPELRDRVIMYQNECDDVLWDYWTKGQAINQRKTITPEQQAILHDIVDQRAGNNRKIRAEMWARHNRHFNVAKYSQLLAIHFDDAMRYLQNMELHEKLELNNEVQKPYDIRDFVNRTQGEVMDYLWTLQKQIINLGGTPLPMPFDDETIAQGFIGHFLNGKRMMLNFSHDQVHLQFVAYNSVTVDVTEIADVITKRETMPKQVLADIADAALKRLAK